MKISIVTPVFNSVRYIRSLIENIKSQERVEIEHIVLDGGSTDGTVEVLKEYSHLKWISEKDKGQSHALNKGFRISTGEILAWQNADDLYCSNAFNTIVDFFKNNSDVDMTYGDYQLIKADGSWICNVHPIKWNQWLFSHGRFVPAQPTVFWRRRVYETIGELNENLHYCMDVDFVARVCKRFRIEKIPETIGQFRVHYASKTQNPINKKSIEKEYYTVLSNNFNYNILDRIFFIIFQKRKIFTTYIKQNLLRK